MRRITIALMGTLSALVVLFSYRTSTGSATSATTVPAAGSVGSSSSSAASSSVAATSSGSGSGSGSSGSGSGGGSVTYTGSAVETRWGIVQVRITVSNGKITAAQAIQVPDGNPHDEEINSYAVPQLNTEVVQKQSGSIDAISGATVTSDGYISSVQSAVDEAHL